MKTKLFAISLLLFSLSSFAGGVVQFSGDSMKDGASVSCDGVTYTLHANGNDDKGTGIVIDQPCGISVTASSGTVSSGPSVAVVRYADYESAAHAGGPSEVLFSYQLSSPTAVEFDRVGVAVTNGTDFLPIWRGAYASKPSTDCSFRSVSSDVRTAAVSFFQNADKIYPSLWLDCVQSGYWKGMSVTGDTSAIWIGGPSENGATSGNLFSMRGLRIYAIAIYPDGLTETELADCRVPANAKWIGPTDGNWSDIANWNEKCPPAAGETVGLLSTDRIRVGLDLDLSRITVIGDGTLIFYGDKNSVYTAPLKPPMGLGDYDYWTGVAELRTFDYEGADGLPLQSYANRQSTLVFAGVRSVIRYELDSFRARTLRLIGDGFTYLGSHIQDRTIGMRCEELVGDGELSCETDDDATSRSSLLLSGDMHAFAGDVSVDAKSRLILLRRANAPFDSKRPESVYVGTEMQFTLPSSATWSSPSGFRLCGTLGGSGKLIGPLRFSSDAALVCPDGGSPLRAEGELSFDGSLRVVGAATDCTLISGGLSLIGGLPALSEDDEPSKHELVFGDGCLGLASVAVQPNGFTGAECFYLKLNGANPRSRPYLRAISGISSDLALRLEGFDLRVGAPVTVDTVVEVSSELDFGTFSSFSTVDSVRQVVLPLPGANKVLYYRPVVRVVKPVVNP